MVGMNNKNHLFGVHALACPPFSLLRIIYLMLSFRYSTTSWKLQRAKKYLEVSWDPILQVSWRIQICQ
jgi:hypothetical protein